MQQWLTWESFLLYLLFCLIVYVVFVIIVYYKNDIRRIINNKHKASSTKQWKRVQPNQHKELNTVPAPINSIHTQVHELLEELKLVEAAATHDALNKAQILEAVQFRLRRYPALKESALQSAVHQHIIHILSLQLKISVTDEEINSLW